MEINFRAFVASTVSILTMLAASPTLAQDVSPGAACAVAGAFTRSGGPELSGAGHFMVCSGSVWTSALSYSSTGNTLVPGALSLTGDIAPASIAASQNNYAPTGHDTASVLRLTASAAYNITGLAGGVEGRVLTIMNVGTNAITLKNQDAASTAANRFAFGADIVLSADNTVGLIYDSTSQRWRAGGRVPFDPCPNSLPASFSVTDQVSVAVSTLTTSNIVQITGITGCTVQVTVSGQGSPQYQTCSDAACTTFIQNWTSSSGQIQDNQYIRLRLTSSPSGNVTYLAAVTVGSRVAGWSVSTVGNCAASPPVGTFCADGTVYTGLSPDGGTKMYATPCPQGQTWNGVICTGSVTTTQFSTGNTILTGVANSGTTGEANTTALAALANADAPYSAAQVCLNLVAHGQSDWYLPATNEISVLQSACDKVPGILCSDTTNHWTSEELAAGTANRWQGYGGSASMNKTVANRIFCVRKD